MPEKYLVIALPAAGSLWHRLNDGKDIWGVYSVARSPEQAEQRAAEARQHGQFADVAVLAPGAARAGISGETVADYDTDPNFSSNQDRVHGEDRFCLYCGRPVRKTTPVYWLHEIDGGGTLIRYETPYYNDGADMGAWPIGNDCLKNHPEFQPFVSPKKYSAEGFMQQK